MRASSRPRNENYSAPLSARALNTTTFGSRGNAPSSSVAAPAHSRRTRLTLSSERSTSPRPRATTPSASPAPTSQGGAQPAHSNPFVSTFHANYTTTTSNNQRGRVVQDKENVILHTAMKGGAGATSTPSKTIATTKNAIYSSYERGRGEERDDEYRKYQQNFSLSPEGVVEFKPVPRPSNEQYMNEEEEDEEDYSTLSKGRRGHLPQNASTLISDTSTLTATTIAAASPLHIANKVIKATSNGNSKNSHENAHFMHGGGSTFGQRRIAFEGADSDEDHDDDDYGFGRGLARKPSTISKNSISTRMHVKASAGPEGGGGSLSSSDRLLTSEQIKELLDENDKLRFIEREFWVLLGEREALQDEVEALRKAKDQLHMGGSPSAPSRHGVVSLLPAASAVPITVDERSQRVEAILERHGGGGASAGRDIYYSTLAETNSGEEKDKELSRAGAEAARLKLENESLQIALHECMDMMISEEVQNSATNTIKRDGPVSAYLAWLRSKHEKGEAATALETARQELVGVASSLFNNHAHSHMNNNNGRSSTIRDDAADAKGRGGGPATNRDTFQALRFELEQSQAQVRALQQELDRTDLSRRQALEDCEHMRGQVEALSSQLQQTLASYREAQRALLKYQVKGEQQVSQHPQGHQGHSRDGPTSPLHNLRARGDGPAAAVTTSTTNNDFTAVLSAQLAHKNAEIHQARARMARLQREREAESFALANDTLRIQRELSTRRSQSAPRTSTHTNPSSLPRSASPPHRHASSNYHNNNNGVQSIITDATTILMADDEL